METEQVVRIYKSDSIKEISDEYGFSKSDINDIDKILRTTNCYRISASSGGDVGSYCRFSDGGNNTKTGLIYISNADQVAGKDVEDLVYAGVYVTTAYFVDEQWIYFEGIPFHAMD